MEACCAHNPEVGRSKLPPAKFFSRISIEEDIETVTSPVNEREYGKIYTTLSQKNHNTRSRVLKIPNTSRMAKWKRTGPITQRSVDRNYLLLIFFQEIRGEKKSKQLPLIINKRESGNIYTTLPQKNHKTRSTVFIKP